VDIGEQMNNKILIVIFLFTSLIQFTVSGGDQNMLKTGTNAPEFILQSNSGDTIKLSNFIDKNFVVLIFYPGDQTPVCTKQLCEIRDNYTQLSSNNAVVFGINPAGEDSHTAFVKKHDFQFPLLVDKDREITKLYGCTGTLGTKRTVYVIDKKGKIIYAKRGKTPITKIIKNFITEKK